MVQDKPVSGKPFVGEGVGLEPEPEPELEPEPEPGPEPGRGLRPGQRPGLDHDQDYIGPAVSYLFWGGAVASARGSRGL